MDNTKTETKKKVPVLEPMRKGFDFPKEYWPVFTNIVRKYVEDHNGGIKAVELAVHVTKQTLELKLSNSHILNGIEECARVGIISSFDYVLPDNSSGAGKIKTMYFPTGTKYLDAP